MYMCVTDQPSQIGMDVGKVTELQGKQLKLTKTPPIIEIPIYYEEYSLSISEAAQEAALGKQRVTVALDVLIYSEILYCVLSMCHTLCQVLRTQR